jgi:4-hydroxy-tetrahydrodipicolinate reductase
MIECVSTIKLGIIGAAGRMGTALREHLSTVADIELRALLELGESLDRFLAAKPKVVVDLSLGAAVAEHGAEIVKAGIPYIIGATGLSAEAISALTQASESSGSPVLIVPNFSLGANLMIKFATAAAKLMEAPVITERHHAGKKDAPSGTASFTAERIAGARPAACSGCGENVPGVMGGMVAGVPVHSVRGDGYVAEQQVQFSLPGETLTIEHKSIDRRCFMPGIVYAIRNICKVHGLQTGLDTILEI